ncbi:MAG: hypothetical protein CL755_02115 [Chloroflexi bacterium]|nr:hypothetical protein [Chloroflexota bacterium]
MAERTLDGTRGLRDRYSRLVLERFHAMLANPKFSRVRRKWLRHLGRQRPFANIDDWVDRENEWRGNDPKSRGELTLDVTALSESFAFAHWHVLLALFVREYDPVSKVGSMFPLDVWHPRSHILVTAPEPGLVENLQRLAVETGILIGLQPAADTLEPRSDRGGLDGILLEVNLPLEFPPDLVVLAVRCTLATGKDIIRAAGFQLPLRVRTGDSGNKNNATLVVCAGDDSVLTKLEAACAAHELQLRIDQMRDQTSDHGWAPLANVRMEIQFAPDVGAETLVRFVKSAIMNARLALKVVGLDLGQRLRSSPLIELSRILQVDGGRLARRGLGDLAEEQLGTSAVVNGHLTPEAEKSIGLAKSRRNEIRRRLVKKALLK